MACGARSGLKQTMPIPSHPGFPLLSLTHFLEEKRRREEENEHHGQRKEDKLAVLGGREDAETKRSFFKKDHQTYFKENDPNACIIYGLAGSSQGVFQQLTWSSK